MNIAIIRLSSLGDIIFSAPTAYWLKSLYPNAKITWFVDSAFSELLKDNPYIDEIAEIDLRKIKKLKNITSIIVEYKKLKNYPEYDYIIDLQGLLKSAVIAKILNGNIYGFDYKSAREPIASFFYDKKFAVDYNINILLRYEKLLKAIFGDFKIKNVPAIYAQQNKFDTKDTVLINVGASKPNKRYEHYVDVINALQVKTRIIWGNNEELEIAKDIASKTNAVILPKMSISDLKCAISECLILVGGDSGVTHMAWALNKPSITIFGATPSQRNCVQTDINKIVDASLNIDAKKLDYKNFAINTIKPQEIIKIAQGLLDG